MAEGLTLGSRGEEGLGTWTPGVLEEEGAGP